jgi:hypothetical protein
MIENEPLMECARAMIRRHGSRAAEMAQHLADGHRALKAEEIADFWSAVARQVRRLLVPGVEERDDARAKRWRMPAEEYRAVAAQMKSPLARDSYLRMADNCDALAGRREKAARPTRPKKKPLSR